MHGRNSTMLRVSRECSCPICGRPDWCLVSADGAVAICPRTPEGALKDLGEAGYLHAVDPEREISLAHLPSVPDRTPRRDFEPMLRHHRERAEPRLHDLARQLGVSVDALRSLKVGYDQYRGQYLFPERDGQGDIIGILTRDSAGQKRRLKGSKNGLAYADAWDAGEGPVLLVEGPSDTAALMTLGCNAIGRPSNRGGAPLLAELLREFPDDRDIIVLGDNDQKDDGLWPGKDGAIHTATDLATRLERPLYWCLAPDGVKDARAWLNAHGGSQPERMRKCFLDGLQLQVVTPPPVIRTTRPYQEPISLESYRKLMLAARLQSLDRPGFYLDNSTTGAGKSAIDLQVIMELRALTGEVA